MKEFGLFRKELFRYLRDVLKKDYATGILRV